MKWTSCGMPGGDYCAGKLTAAAKPADTLSGGINSRLRVGTVAQTSCHREQHARTEFMLHSAHTNYIIYTMVHHLVKMQHRKLLICVKVSV